MGGLGWGLGREDDGPFPTVGPSESCRGDWCPIPCSSSSCVGGHFCSIPRIPTARTTQGRQHTRCGPRGRAQGDTQSQGGHAHTHTTQCDVSTYSWIQCLALAHNTLHPPQPHIPRACAGVTQGGLAYLTKSLLPQGGTAPPTATTTILFSHANGFNKEVYLPVWEELEKCWRAHAHASARLPLCLVSFDFSGHGDSRSVQGDGNGKHSDWKRVAGGDLLEMLDALSQTEQPDAGGGGAAPRGKCIGVGHSLGAAAMTMVALEQPGLFSGGLVLVEPVLLPVDRDPTMTHMLAERALKRRATWYAKRKKRLEGTKGGSVPSTLISHTAPSFSLCLYPGPPRQPPESTWPAGPSFSDGTPGRSTPTLTGPWKRWRKKATAKQS